MTETWTDVTEDEKEKKKSITLLLSFSFVMWLFFPPPAVNRCFFQKCFFKRVMKCAIRFVHWRKTRRLHLWCRFISSWLHFRGFLNFPDKRTALINKVMNKPTVNLVSEPYSVSISTLMFSTATISTILVRDFKFLFIPDKPVSEKSSSFSCFI